MLLHQPERMTGHLVAGMNAATPSDGEALKVVRRYHRHTVHVGDQIGPVLDAEVRRRLGRRYGSEIDAWLDGLPARLHDLAQRWRLDLGPLVRRGTVSVVLRCRDHAGTPAILKVAPDRHRILNETRALGVWRTCHVPHVIASDARQGALLMEAIQRGTALDESDEVPEPGRSPTWCADCTSAPRRSRRSQDSSSWP
jgi:hypothetical protein